MTHNEQELRAATELVYLLSGQSYVMASNEERKKITDAYVKNCDAIHMMAVKLQGERERG